MITVFSSNRFREHQEQAVREISDKFRGGARTVFLNAPVGSGKSFIHLAVAHNLRLSTFITTPQVLLVKQYARETAPGAKWDGLARTLSGRQNYPCALAKNDPKYRTQSTLAVDDVHEVLSTLAGEPPSAAGAACTYRMHWPVGRHKHSPLFPDKCITKAAAGFDVCVQGCYYYHFDQCEYYRAKAAAQQAPVSVLTLDYFMAARLWSQSGANGGWRARSLLIVDEAHSLDGDLTRFFSFEMSPKMMKRFHFDTLNETEDTVGYLRTYLPFYWAEEVEILKRLQKQAVEATSTKKQLKALSLQEALVEHLQRINDNLDVENAVWVHTLKADQETHVWRPLSAVPFTHRLFESFDHVLLSSATFLHPDRLADEVGLCWPYDQVVMPDTVAPRQAPIHLLNTIRFSHRTLAADLPRALQCITVLAGAHPNERGLIHCNSYAIAEYLEKNAPRELKDRLVFHERVGRIKAFEQWKDDMEARAIFVPVAMSEGLDLPGDEARWQIIVKAPFLPLVDPWVKARHSMVGGAEWYDGRALVNVMQASGRIVRSKADWGVTYVLDSHVGRLVKMYWNWLPTWFRERLNVPGAVGPPVPALETNLPDG